MACSIPAFSCFVFFNLFLSSISAQLEVPHPNVLHHPQLGIALLLPLSRHSANSSLPRRKSAGHPRQLVDNTDANARMTLYDDLLTKGYYTSRLWIGTPPQEFALIVDTGSTVTYVPCSSCTHCGKHQDPRFKPEASSSYKPVGCGPDCSSCDSGRRQCKYERRYAEMSTSKGLLGNDLVSFGNDSTLGPERLVFGCETAETGDIYEQRADGIMGLGRGSLSIVDQLVGRNAMANSFSLCYGGMDEGGGAMIMGAIPSPPDMVFTHSDTKRSGYYNLGLQEVGVGGIPLPLDPGTFDAGFGTVLDSGTTYAYFPEKAFLAFKDALIRQLGKLHMVAGPDPNFPDVCFGGAGSDLSQLSNHFPQVYFKFGDGQRVSLAPENYLFKHAKVQGAYCLGIFSNGKDSATLLGGIVVRNVLVTYDRANHRIGFWKTNCSDLWSNLAAVTLGPSGAPLAAPSLVPVLAPEGPAVQPPVGPGLAYAAANVEVRMIVSINHTGFNRLKSGFVEDLSRGLDIDLSQVTVVSHIPIGKNVSVLWTVYLAATDEHLLNNTIEGIIDRLKRHEVHFRDPFGTYEMTGWTVTSVNYRSDHSSKLRMIIFVVTILLLVVLVGVGFLVWWYLWRFRGQVQSKYVTIDEQNIELIDQQL